MAEKLLEAPKKAILLGLTIGYSGLSSMEFSIYILHQHNYCVCGLHIVFQNNDYKKEPIFLPDVSNNAIHGV